MTTALKFGMFESHPACFTDDEAWVYQHDNVWRQMNPAEVTQHAAVVEEDIFMATYHNLPALPDEAFLKPMVQDMMETSPGLSEEMAKAILNGGLNE